MYTKIIQNSKQTRTSRKKEGKINNIVKKGNTITLQKINTFSCIKTKKNLNSKDKKENCKHDHYTHVQQ